MKAFFAAIVVFACSQETLAQVFKCKGANGAITISDTGCTKSTTVKTMAADTISTDRQEQAYELQQKNREKLASLNAEKDAEKPSKAKQRQQTRNQMLITDCGGSGCWDMGGNFYHKSGNVIIRNDGKICFGNKNAYSCPP